MKQGDIYLVDFEPSVGHEYRKERPAVIVSGNKTLKSASLITVMPITSNLNNKRGDDIPVKKDAKNNLRKNSLIRVNNIYSFDAKRFKALIGLVDEKILQQIKAYIPKHFGL